MATTKFNLIITDTAQILKATRANATLDAGTYTSAMLARYANRAIREFLIEKLVTLTPFQFAEAYPEYVQESGALTLAAGVVAKPSDSIYILEVRQGTTRFARVQQKDVEGLVTQIGGVVANRTMIPSATRPFFWDDGGNIHTLGITSGDIVARYVVVHQDIAPSIASAGVGKYGTSIGLATYTAATNTLAGATMSVNFAVTDVNKNIMLLSTGTIKVYLGKIASYISTTSVTLAGDGLPTTNLAADDITAILVSDVDITDLKLNEYWHPEIVQRCVQMALADAKNTQLS